MNKEYAFLAKENERWQRRQLSRIVAGVLIILSLAVLAIDSFGQKTINDLEEVHKDALEKFLAKNPRLSFRSQNILSPDYQKVAADDGFFPNYAVGDFNRDKRPDFAVLLKREGKSVFMSSDREISDFNPDYPLTVVIFNGQTLGGFVPVFQRKVSGPPAAFIRFDTSLFFGIFDTDSDTIEFIPYGQKYTVKFAGL